jgi:hypothetical protein
VGIASFLTLVLIKGGLICQKNIRTATLRWGELICQGDLYQRGDLYASKYGRGIAEMPSSTIPRSLSYVSQQPHMGDSVHWGAFDVARRDILCFGGRHVVVRRCHRSW